MANLRKDILSEEERAAGFEPGEHDDDTFSLGTTEYVEDLEEIFSIEDESADEPELKEPDDYVALTNTVSIEEPQLSEEQTSIENEPHLQVEPEEEVLVMDDDFKDMVKDLLNKEKPKREILAKITGNEDSQANIEDNFNPEENLKDADSVFLDEIAKQEEYIPEQEPVEEHVHTEPEISKTPEAENYAETTDTIITEKTIRSEEKENKKRFPVWLVGSIAAGILIVSASIIYFVFLTPPKKADIMDADTIKTELFTKTDEKKVEQEQENIAHADTTVETEVEKTVEAEAEKPVIQPVPAPTSATKPESKPEPKPIADVKPKQTIQPREVAPLKPRTTATAKPIKIAEPDKPAKIVVEKKEESLATVIPEKKPDTKEVFERDITKQEFAVQIYSSPSKEDAERWLEKLRAKNINDAYITEQKIRDVMWYRVRFGKYETREEARAAALRFGFAQTWIDRVR